MVAISSSYDAIITTDITRPPEKYVVTNIREFFAEFGFKLYSFKDRNWTLCRLSILMNISDFENCNVYIWSGGMLTIFYRSFRFNLDF